MEDHFPSFAGLKAFFAVGLDHGVAEAAKRLGVTRSAIRSKAGSWLLEI